jgi:hypothetical protein
MRYYIDTEFNSFGGELMSLGMHAEDGRSMYLLYPKLPDYADWVKRHVVPHLHAVPKYVAACQARSRKIPLVQLGPEARHVPTTAAYLDAFFKGDPSPHVIADWPDDIKYLCEELLTGPGKMVDVPHITFEVNRVDAWPNDIRGAVQHNAWWDALALMQALTNPSTARYKKEA